MEYIKKFEDKWMNNQPKYETNGLSFSWVKYIKILK